MPSYWLFKSEPDVFSIDDLAAVESEPWDGVRNYQARNNLQAMKVGDVGFFYHSRLNPSGIVGICEVVKEAYPDHTAFDSKNKYYDPKSTPEKPRWFMVDIKFVDKFSRMIDLHEIKSDPKLAEMALVKSSRLSVQPVTAKEWKHICKLAGG